MADEKKTAKSAGTMSSAQDGYRLAKIIRQGNRELSRQYNTKKTRQEK